jgi:hypothetical protein
MLGDMKIPSRADWGDIDRNALDAEWALKQFVGKSFAEAEAMFQYNALYYQEDLQSMPSIPFHLTSMHRRLQSTFPQSWPKATPMGRHRTYIWLFGCSRHSAI